MVCAFGGEEGFFLGEGLIIWGSLFSQCNQRDDGSRGALMVAVGLVFS